MIKICVTGCIGSGKSTVCKTFAAGGIPIFYCDDESKKLMYKNINKIIDAFGDSVLKDDEFSKELLAKIVFDDKKKLNELTNVLYPLVREELENFYGTNKQEKICVVENAVLFESGSQDNFDYIVTVAVDEKTRMERVMARDKVDEKSIQNRLNNQLPQEYKIENSDFVIWNNGNRINLNMQVANIFEKIMNNEKQGLN